MLKYSMKVSQSAQYSKLRINEIYVAPDLSFISGVTDYIESLVDNEKVSITSPYLPNPIILPISIKKVKRQGYILCSEKLYINTIQLTNEDINTVEYIEYKGVYYYSFMNGDIDGFMIDGTFYQRATSNYIIIQAKYWIENGEVSINGVTYSVNMNLKENSKYEEGYEYPIIRNSETSEEIFKINDSSFTILDYAYSKWKLVYLFYIETGGNEEFSVTDSTSATLLPYVTYSGIDYDFVEDETGCYALVNGAKYYASDYFTSLDSFCEHSDEYSITIEGTEVAIENKEKSVAEGLLLMLFNDELNYTFSVTDKIIAYTDDSYFYTPVYSGTNNNDYISYLGQNYLVQKRLCDTVSILGEDNGITYLNDERTRGYIVKDNSKIYLSFKTDENENVTATYTNKIFISSGNTVDFDYQSGSTDNSCFEVSLIDGVEINNKKYEIVIIDNKKECYIKGRKKYELEIKELEGSSLMVCQSTEIYESVNNDVYDTVKAIHSDIVNNLSLFKFIHENSVFGDVSITPYIGAYQSLQSSTPMSSDDFINLKNNLEINKIDRYAFIPLKFATAINNNIRKDDLTDTDSVGRIVDEKANIIRDMEKDVYYPVNSINDELYDVTKINFNLHFRTRDLDTWKINGSTIEETGVYEYSGKTFSDLSYSDDSQTNWFITDYYPYIDQTTANQKKIQSSSDLIGLLGFNDDDVKYRRSKISKSFLRLSFYSTNNPNTQMLLSTSTIFFDENKMYHTLNDISINNIKIDNDEVCYQKVASTSDSTAYRYVSTMREKYIIYANTIKKFFDFDDKYRISSQLSVKNKYITDVSSEGFYMYMFKEYSSNQRPQTVYLKVDFCHAGYGKTIPFIIPKDTTYNRPYYLYNNFDVEAMKEGISTSELSDNLYIPIHLIYDENRKKYIYYIDESLNENSALGIDNNIMTFNLFELKLKDDSYENGD